MALIYGTYALYLERPLYVTFNVDRFNLVSITSINIQELRDKYPERSLFASFFKEAKFVYVEIPDDTEDRMIITIEAMTGGKDFFQHPKFYRQYQDFSDNLNSSSHQLSLTNILQFHPGLAERINNIAEINNLTLHELLFYPIVGKKSDAIIVLQKHNAKQIAIIENIDPWKIKH